MQGLLRHSASIWSGLGGLPYPTAGLQVIVYNQTYEDGGTTYYRTSLGIGLPVVSGTGLDTIIDFAPLSDTRFDKGSYVGNAYGLPENYDFPYVNIYFDETSEATRYHWKITDFHYANILSQSLLVDNMFFLKAKATTNTSNVIASVDRLYIYSTALEDSNLTKIKTHIGIQDDFYGDNLILNGGFETSDLTYWESKKGEGTITITPTSHEGNYAVVLTRTSGSNILAIKLYQDFSVMIGVPYILSFWTRGDGVNSGFWSLYDVENSTYYQYYINTNIAGTVYSILNYNFTANSNIARLQLVANNNESLAQIYYDTISCKPVYQNYYKS